MSRAQQRRASPVPRWRAFGAPVDLDLHLDDADRPATVTRVLAACRLEPPPDEDELWRLPVSARIAALLAVVAATERAEAIVLQLRCPARGCGEALEIALPYDALRERAEGSDGPLAVTTAEGASLRLRRPTGDDQRRWRTRGWRTREEAVRGIVAALAVEGAAAAASADADDVARIAAALDEADPLVAFHVDCTCPACGTAATLDVDLERVALERLRRVQRALLADVHRLASRYGWTEEQVLRLPSWRRAEYLRLVDAEGGA